MLHCRAACRALVEQHIAVHACSVTIMHFIGAFNCMVSKQKCGHIIVGAVW